MKFNLKSNYNQTEIGKLPKEWEIKKLKELLIIKGRIGWKGLKKSEFSNKGIIIINGPNIKNKKIDWKNCLRVPKWRYDESEEISVKKNDILMTKDGTIGKLAYIKIIHEPATLASGIFLIRTKSKKLSQNFLYNYFNSNIFKNLVASRIEGSVIPHLYQRDIEQLIIPIPSYVEQHDISKILYDLDMQIENLQNQNKLLEQMAQAIFKSWFVDFDLITEFKDSELGKIPKEWHWEQLDNVAIFLNGLPLQKYRTTSNSFLPVIKIREMKNGISKNTEKARTDVDKKYIVNNGDILFSWSGTLELTIWEFDKGALNQHLFKVTSLTYEKWFYYMWIKYHLNEFRRIANDKTTTMGHIQRRHISEAMVLIPSISIMKKMNRVMGPLFDQIINNKLSIQTLIKIHNELLPKLMSGELRV